MKLSGNDKKINMTANQGSAEYSFRSSDKSLDTDAFEEVQKEIELVEEK